MKKIIIISMLSGLLFFLSKKLDYNYITTSSNFSYTIQNNYLYYLKDNNLTKLNLTTKKRTSLPPIASDYTCNLKDFIICTTKNNTIIYDLNLNILYNGHKNNLIPYKDTYLYLENNNLILIQNEETVPFKTIEFNQEIEYIDYFKTSSNTFILLKSIDKYFIYNINSAEITEIDYPNYYEYAKGFYFSNNNSLKIYDLIESKEINYDNLDINFTISTINESNDILYYYDKNKLISYNLNTKKKEEKNISNVTSLKVIFNYLIIEKENQLYTIKINSSISDDPETFPIITELKEKYSLNIHIKDDLNINFPDFTAEKEENTNTIKKALNRFVPIINKFTPEFYKSFYNNNYNGLHIYLTSTLTPLDYETQVASPAAYSLNYDNAYLIVININEPNLEEIICHELMHNIEFNLTNNNEEIFSKWHTYNPPNFYYQDSYNKETIFDYTINEENTENVYFIDKYSHTYPEEDRARIFENICSVSNSSILNEYNNLTAKALYLKTEILKYYPELENTNLFTSLNISN